MGATVLTKAETPKIGLKESRQKREMTRWQQNVTELMVRHQYSGRVHMEFQRAAPGEAREKWYRMVKAKADLKANGVVTQIQACYRPVIC